MSVTRIDDKVYPTREHLTSTSLAKMTPTERAIHKKSSELLGQVFFAPILAKMHESPFKTEISSGGRGGEAFAPMMDALMIKKVVPPTGHLVQRFAGNILHHLKAQEKAKEVFAKQKEEKLKASQQQTNQQDNQKEQPDATRDVDLVG